MCLHGETKTNISQIFYSEKYAYKPNLLIKKSASYEMLGHT